MAIIVPQHPKSFYRLRKSQYHLECGCPHTISPLGTLVLKHGRYVPITSPVSSACHAFHPHLPVATFHSFFSIIRMPPPPEGCPWLLELELPTPLVRSLSCPRQCYTLLCKTCLFIPGQTCNCLAQSVIQGEGGRNRFGKRESGRVYANLDSH